MAQTRKNMSSSDMSIQVKRYNKANNIKDVITLVRYMVDQMGYVTAKWKLLSQYNIEITIDWRYLR